MRDGPPWPPPDGMLRPRFRAPCTFMCLPHVTRLEGVDFAVAGVPFDTGATFRVGARFGPEAIRSISALLRPYHPEHEIALFPALSGIDYGDLPTVPGYLPQAHERIAAAAETLFRAGLVPVFLGGDHSISLPLLRAAVAAHGRPLSLLHFDSHGDVWPGAWGGLDTHGTPFRRAVEEGLLETQHSLQIGLRGPVFDAGDIPRSRELGFQVVTAAELHQRGVADVLQQVQALLAGRAVYLSFDIDFVDPAFAPGTGTPETGGFSSAQCHQLLRGLRGLNFIGFDLVEVLPAYDPAGITALLAANLVYEFIALIALQRREGAARR